jgi:hypothetical protein
LALGLPKDAIDPELIRLAAVWSRLPLPIRAAVAALVRTAMPSDGSVAGTGLDDSLPPGFEKLTPRE